MIEYLLMGWMALENYKEEQDREDETTSDKRDVR